MSLIRRMLYALFVLAALLATSLSLSADWFRDCILLLEAQRKGDQLSRDTLSTIERVCIKEKIALALRNGDISLIDAAGYFCSLHEDSDKWRYTPRQRPARQDVEGWCREVIEWTEGYISCEQSSSQAEAVRQRLEKELREQLGKHDTTVLPD